MSALTNSTIIKYRETLALKLCCPICLQLYSRPVSLPCGHVYCHVCIQTLGEGLDRHCCPECQADYQEDQVLVISSKMSGIVESRETAAGQVKPAVVECKTKCSLDVATQHPQNEGNDIKSKEVHTNNFQLASQVKDLAVQLELAENVLKKEKQHEADLTVANKLLREKSSEHLRQLNAVVLKYGNDVMQLLDEELSPEEASVSLRVGQATQLTEQLKQLLLRAESLLAEGGDAKFTEDFQDLQPHIAEMTGKAIGESEGLVEPKGDPVRVIPKLERKNLELKESLGAIQRSLRKTLNPSEVTFDISTAHPNLILSEDLKTVTFSTTKQPYPPSPHRFTSFFQVLSSQSFSKGDHLWEVELHGAPWIIGLCCSGKMERSGISSALESNSNAFCLMWFNNMLTAFERGRDVPLKRTTVSCRLEIRLSFSTGSLSFYKISPTSGKTLVYTFKADWPEPVHLAYRMISGHPEARVTIISK